MTAFCDTAPCSPEDDSEHSLIEVDCVQKSLLPISPRTNNLNS